MHPSAWIAPTATLIGDVTVEADASVWYGAIVRADFGPVLIREGANVQDGSVIHSGSETPTEIGPGATVGHLCVLHGCVIGAEAVIGNGSVVQDGAEVGPRALVAAGSTVPPGARIPPQTVVSGPKAESRGPLSKGARWWVENNPAAYRRLARQHKETARPVR